MRRILGTKLCVVSEKLFLEKRFMLTASFAHCETDGGWKRRPLPGMELEGHSNKTDACKARHLSGEMIWLSRHERKHMYDTIWMVETRLPSTPNEMNSPDRKSVV